MSECSCLQFFGPPAATLHRKLSLVSSSFSLTSSCAQTSWLLAHRACRLLQLQLTWETSFNGAKASANLVLIQCPLSKMYRLICRMQQTVQTLTAWGR